MNKNYFLEIASGTLEQFDYELERVVANISDPNTPATKPRKSRLPLR